MYCMIFIFVSVSPLVFINFMFYFVMKIRRNYKFIMTCVALALVLRVLNRQGIISMNLKLYSPHSDKILNNKPRFTLPAMRSKLRFH